MASDIRCGRNQLRAKLKSKVISFCGFNRRKLAAQPVEQNESDRLPRIMGIVALAEGVFDNADKAQVWLNCENRAFDGETPLAIAETERGVRAVETLLGQIAHGIAA
ncbi:DUF2384 domain-containing protein [Sphingomonas sp. CL5.1]|uniref:antitoxin Xre/MbcA/ParS toxin-binding domain-containing protein n=1 Tax=Sphingomonas sp. CL5.1 TaxID=2653203 RepID=UPI0015823C10|nr:MbcA/ParS/Xre antitoxin family protein [Sphingomonas sp. CL5.1]QKS00641.1 DUF2384 domain-containing protein [Sphingomonas sp. CL5.1]